MLEHNTTFKTVCQALFFYICKISIGIFREALPKNREFGRFFGKLPIQQEARARGRRVTTAAVRSSSLGHWLQLTMPEASSLGDRPPY